MTSFDFDFSQAEQASKKQARLRMALHGASGCGKTYSALAIGCEMGDRVFLLDTEHGSASKYADKFKFDTLPNPLPDFHPERLISFLNKGPDRYDVLIVDSMTHFWNAQRGFLELVDEAAKKSQAKGGKYDSFGAWKSIDPIYRKLVYAIHACRAHVILTMRAKQEYSKEEEGGKTKIKKMGMAPQMRDEFIFEQDVEGMINMDHELVIGKTRCSELDGNIYEKPGKNVAAILKRWLSDGAPAREMPPQQQDSAQQEPDWFVEALASIKAAENQEELTAAQNGVVKFKGQMTEELRQRLYKAINEAKKTLSATAAQ